MKKYLLGACLIFSTQVFAYTGATADFTKLVFNGAMAESVVESFNGVDAKKQQCVSDILKPILDELAVKHIDGFLTEHERQLMDDFFDTPLGQEMFKELRAGNGDFIRFINLDEYDKADYAQYMTVFAKYNDGGDIGKTWFANDELLRAMFESVPKCDLLNLKEQASERAEKKDMPRKVQ